jgi:hypothetical protein
MSGAAIGLGKSAGHIPQKFAEISSLTQKIDISLAA